MTEIRTVLLTGASGFIAKHICLGLLNAGYHVRGSIRTPAKAREVVEAVTPRLTTTARLERRLRFVVLDLNADAGWAEAIEGVEAVVHTASPVPLIPLGAENEIVRPAVDGTMRALKAAHNAGVTRVILTSSVVSMYFTKLRPGKLSYDETDWTDLTDPAVTPYIKSKTLAEMAAWEFVQQQSSSLQLTVINPGFVLGRPLDRRVGASLRLIRWLMLSKYPAIPRIGFAFVDVRDIAAMHVRALSVPDSAGMRVLGAVDFYWLVDIAKQLASACPDRKITTRVAPDWLVRLHGLVDRTTRSTVPRLGRVHKVDNRRARELLGLDFIAVENSLRCTASFLRDGGFLD